MVNQTLYFSLAFNARAYGDLERQLREQVTPSVAPVRWYGLLDRISRELTGQPIQRFVARDVFVGKSLLFSSHFTPEVLLASQRRGRVIFLCWGIGHYSGLRHRTARFVLSRARHLVVNEERTRDEIMRLTGREATLIPYFVDSNYFRFHPEDGRCDFLFCPGANDRDAQLLVELAMHGYRVIWLVGDTVRRNFEGAHRYLELRSNVSFTELRWLYQHCRMVILPLVRDIHAAGQTTGLEALACGAPLLISKGRTSSLLGQFASVKILASANISEWAEAIATRIGCSVGRSDMLRDVSCEVAEMVRYETHKLVVARLLERVAHNERLQNGD
jgi:hypothetical protein